MIPDFLNQHPLVSQAIATRLVADQPELSGLHPIEPDFAERGIWVERRLRIPIPPMLNGTIVVSGLYFPKLIAAQNGSAQTALRFVIAGADVHTATLREHGRFTITFEVVSRSGGTVGAMFILCDHCFVPAQIGDGNDQRELTWRLLSLQVADKTLFDCTRQLNVFLISAVAADDALAPGDERHALVNDAGVRFHLDRPHCDATLELQSRFIASGWACEPLAGRAVRVRVVLGQQKCDAQPVDRQDVQDALASISSLPLDTGFQVEFTAPVGIWPFSIETRAPHGGWTPRQRGYLVSAPPARHLPGGKVGHWLTHALPRGLISRVLDRMRKTEGGFVRAQLPSSVRFHLDTPPTDKTHVVSAECIVSGWVVEEALCSSLPVRVVVGETAYPAHTKQREDVQKAFRARGSLPLNTGFACVLALSVGFHRLRIEVQAANGVWILVRRISLLQVPGILRQHRAAPQRSLRTYLQLQRKHEELELPEILRHVATMVNRPRFAIVVDSGKGGSALNETLNSMREQIYSEFSIHLRPSPDSDAALRTHADIALLVEPTLPADAGDFVIFLRAGEKLAQRALYAFASATIQQPSIDLIYADELTEARRREPALPFYKPAWSPDYLETFNYIGFAACFRADLLRACVADIRSAHPYEVVLRVTEKPLQVLHLPKLLGSKRAQIPGTPAQAAKAETSRDIAALMGRLQRTGRSGDVKEHASQPGCYAISLELRQAPMVSIVIPTAGKTIVLDGREIDLISNVIDQILQRSTYKNIEIVVVDNGDLDSGQLDLLHRLGCKRITYTEPIFNISKKLNLGAKFAAGEYLLLMNDDIEILTPDWIERMLEHFEKPHVGVVGGKLLYPDGKTQHVGVVHNGGNPDHVRRLYPADDPGYFYSSCGVRNFAAVTGACMMTPTRVYRVVGGYSEPLAVSYNDADYCLKVGQLGLSVVYAPAVKLTHMESQSRMASADMNEVAWYHERWAAQTVSDPYYNERFLTVASPTFEPCMNERLV